MKLLVSILFFLNLNLIAKAQEYQYVPNEWTDNEVIIEKDTEKLREKSLLFIQENQYQKALLILDKIITENKGIAEDFYLRG
jgi:hypothetical protein